MTRFFKLGLRAFLGTLPFSGWSARARGRTFWRGAEPFDARPHFLTLSASTHRASLWVTPPRLRSAAVRGSSTAPHTRLQHPKTATEQRKRHPR